MSWKKGSWWQGWKKEDAGACIKCGARLLSHGDKLCQECEAAKNIATVAQPTHTVSPTARPRTTGQMTATFPITKRDSFASEIQQLKLIVYATLALAVFLPIVLLITGADAFDSVFVVIGVAFVLAYAVKHNLFKMFEKRKIRELLGHNSRGA